MPAYSCEDRISKMSVSEDSAALVTSDAFWEIGQYKRTVRRAEDSPALCQELSALVKERGEIEANYTKHLRAWSKKWSEMIDKGPEYGTMQSAWKSTLVEAEKRADLHSRIRDRLQEEVQNVIKTWNKDHFHKNTFGGIKEIKEVEESFKKAQKPWAKLYLKVDKAKKEFHQACKSERTAVNQEKNAQADTAVSADQQKKLAEKAERCREEVQKSKDVYKKALDELNANNAKYMEDMSQVFERCQDMERQRLKFFKEMLLGVHKCLDISNDHQLQNIYEDFRRSIELADDNQDLRWWAQNHGTGMAMNWPTFEEYTPELRRIGKDPKPRDAVTLVNQKTTQQQLPQVSDQSFSRNITNASASNNNNSGNVNGGHHNVSGHHPSDPSPFEDDWDSQDPLSDSGEPGVPVRALYDYSGQEEDELTFKKGDVFDKLEDEDEQGWCKGRKDNRIGLYPANYVELVKS